MIASRDERSAEQIRDLVEGWRAALRDRDVARRTADYAPDVVVFDVVEPLRLQGIEPLRERLTEWFSSFDGPIESEVRDLEISADGEVAFCHCLNHFTGSLAAGGELSMWVRFSSGLRRIDGRWMVIHEHASSPFDPATGAAAVGAEP